MPNGECHKNSLVRSWPCVKILTLRHLCENPMCVSVSVCVCVCVCVASFPAGHGLVPANLQHENLSWSHFVHMLPVHFFPESLCVCVCVCVLVPCKTFSSLCTKIPLVVFLNQDWLPPRGRPNSAATPGSRDEQMKERGAGDAGLIPDCCPG